MPVTGPVDAGAVRGLSRVAAPITCPLLDNRTSQIPMISVDKRPVRQLTRIKLALFTWGSHFRAEVNTHSPTSSTNAGASLATCVAASATPHWPGDIRRSSCTLLKPARRRSLCHRRYLDPTAERLDAPCSDDCSHAPATSDA